MFNGDFNSGMTQRADPDLDLMLQNYDNLLDHDRQVVQHLLKQRIQDQMQQEMHGLMEQNLQALNISSLDDLDPIVRQNLIG
jgi:CBS-domain-containing membrane protein